MELRSRLEEVQSRLSEAENEIDTQMQKRLETAETATALQKQVWITIMLHNISTCRYTKFKATNSHPGP